MCETHKVVPNLPIDANMLMTKYNIPEGKTLGNKLKLIEETWVDNSFQILDKEIPDWKDKLEVEENALGVASVAQVHLAKDKSNESEP